METTSLKPTIKCAICGRTNVLDQIIEISDNQSVHQLTCSDCGSEIFSFGWIQTKLIYTIPRDPITLGKKGSCCRGK